MTLALPSRRLAPAWVRNDLWRRARAVPSLDLRFAENKSLVDATTGQNLIDFSRASGATFVDSQGVIRTALDNEPRFDHNPTTGESLGLLVEEARTNSIRNNTMVGAVAGTPGTLPTNWASSTGGLAQQIVGIGTDKGISYIDIRFSGTTTGSQASVNFGNNTEALCSNGQSWASSIYASIVGGSTANISQLFFNSNVWGSNGTVYLTELVSIPNILGQLTSGLTRFTGSATINNASATSLRPYLSFLFNVGAAIDITLRIGLPQLEQGAFATSVIPTSGTAVTRAADVASISGSNFSSWYRQDEGTVFAEYQQYAVGGTVANISDNTSSNFVNIFTSAAANTRASANVFVSAVNNGRIDSGGTFAANSNVKASYGLSAGSRSLSAQGNAVSTSATPAALPTVDRMYVGANHDGDSNWNNGTIRRLTYWPQRLGNEVLQRITQ